MNLPKKIFNYAIAGLMAQAFLLYPLSAADSSSLSLGVVDYMKCAESSKLGKNEQKTLESMSKQMQSILDGKEKELTEMVKKISDPDHTDSLSPEAEKKLKEDAGKLQNELMQVEQQYNMTLRQAKMQIMQKIAGFIAKASETIATEDQLTLVINKDFCPYYNPTLNITDKVVAKMDKLFDEEILKALEASKKPIPENTEQPSE